MSESINPSRLASIESAKLNKYRSSLIRGAVNAGKNSRILGKNHNNIPQIKRKFVDLSLWVRSVFFALPISKHSMRWQKEMQSENGSPRKNQRLCIHCSLYGPAAYLGCSESTGNLSNTHPLAGFFSDSLCMETKSWLFLSLFFL
jgi:hypothetical protein